MGSNDSISYMRKAIYKSTSSSDKYVLNKYSVCLYLTLYRNKTHSFSVRKGSCLEFVKMSFSTV